ncbi:sensor histidine kinase [Spirillospora sp. NPDC048911]|uniref:sensor histidine kinase n=1 Tax=Spirillospora sp. NPDC048911 TaxID=3364527 RepID=UPI003712C929
MPSRSENAGSDSRATSTSAAAPTIRGRRCRIHTPANTPVRVVLRRQENQTVLQVADDGAGMEPEDADRVFDRFFRVGTGSGLGMAIVRAAAEAHHGAAEVTTAPGEGFTTTIRL